MSEVLVAPALDSTVSLAALRAAFLSARRRAATGGLEFALSYSDLLEIFEDKGGRCAISGLAFTSDRIPAAFVKHPFAPSLDRIDCGRGYVAGNVRVVCIAVNFGLGQWGEEVFRTIAEATVRYQPKPSALYPKQLDERIRAAEALMPLL